MKEAPKKDSRYNLWQKGLSVKREAFAQAYVICSNQSEAYRIAYNAEKMTAKSIHDEASKVARSPGVATRIAQLQQENIKNSRIGLTWLLDEMLQTYFLLKEGGDKQMKHRVKMLETLSKHMGVENILKDFNKMSMDEIDAKLANIKKQQEVLNKDE